MNNNVPEAGYDPFSLEEIERHICINPTDNTVYIDPAFTLRLNKHIVSVVIKDDIEIVDRSPTPFHAAFNIVAANLKDILEYKKNGQIISLNNETANDFAMIQKNIESELQVIENARRTVLDTFHHKITEKMQEYVCKCRQIENGQYGKH